MKNSRSYQLHDSYCLMRHGKSYPQELEIILSDPVEGLKDHNGLVDAGRQEVRQSVQFALQEGILNARTIIKASPFSRTWQSAEIAQELLSTESIILEPDLRERCFGKYDGKPDKYYRAVWDLDELFPSHKDMGVESANEVQARFWKVVMDTEKEFHDRLILLVGHGDTLQIGQTAFFDMPSSVHRRIMPLLPAEIRQMRLK